MREQPKTKLRHWISVQPSLQTRFIKSIQVIINAYVGDKFLAAEPVGISAGQAAAGTDQIPEVWPKGSALAVSRANWSPITEIHFDDKVYDKVEDKVKKEGRVFTGVTATGLTRVMSKCHGLSRVVSRVDAQKRPVFIDLSRCHGSARGTRRKVQ